MEKLLYSRRQKEETQQKIEKLSPQKYGKGAYFDLTYTPSKLADHILFRQASYLKKIEEQSSKVRELEAQNKNIIDQVEYLKRQRDGIQKSLNKMIAMYKSIIADMEAKNQERIKLIQTKFREEQQRVIKEKEEEARFVQSEKEILQERISELQKINLDQKELIEKLDRGKTQLIKEIDQLTANNNNLTLKLNDLTKRRQQDAQRASEEINRLKKEYMNAQVQWKNNLRQQLHKKDKQIQKSQRAHKAQLQKVENQRNTQTLLKNQQINELTKTFQGESLRMRDIIQTKDQMIDNLSIENNKQKARVLTLTRDYELQINHLTHQKSRLLEQLEIYAKENEGLAKDKAFITEDLEKQNLKLRDLLYQSSVQLQKCKSELVSLAKDNTRLVNRVKSTEQQAKTWRQSYYINKNRPT